MKLWYKKYRKELAIIIIGIIITTGFYFLNPFAVDAKANQVLALAILMITWWVLDAMPLAVVALLPLVLFPLLHINSMKETSKVYSDPIIYLFMGGFFIGIAIEKWELDKRIALSIIKRTGTNGNNIILGFDIINRFFKYVVKQYGYSHDDVPNSIICYSCNQQACQQQCQHK